MAKKTMKNRMRKTKRLIKNKKMTGRKGRYLRQRTVRGGSDARYAKTYKEIRANLEKVGSQEHKLRKMFEGNIDTTNGFAAPTVSRLMDVITSVYGYSFFDNGPQDLRVDLVKYETIKKTLRVLQNLDAMAMLIFLYVHLKDYLTNGNKKNITAQYIRGVSDINPLRHFERSRAVPFIAVTAYHAITCGVISVISVGRYNGTVNTSGLLAENVIDKWTNPKIYASGVDVLLSQDVLNALKNEIDEKTTGYTPKNNYPDEDLNPHPIDLIPRHTSAF